MSRIAINLIWVKVQKCGGVESYIRNLIEGIKVVDCENEYILIVARDNASSFEKYVNKNFSMIIADVDSEPVTKRLLWENVFFNRLLLKNNIKCCFQPVYLKTWISCRQIKYITTIHDLQQLHYPEYFSKRRYYWAKIGWERAIKTSEKIVTISKYVKNDIQNSFRISENKIVTIYNPVVVDNGELDFDVISNKYDIIDENYYFTVSSLLKHKNLDVLLEVINVIVKNGYEDIPNKLIIAGVGGDQKGVLEKKIEDLGLKDFCIFAGFISDEERNTLYKHCFAFLFPSIFEGFGLPVIEAMMLGTNVITTNMTSIPEVSLGKAIYVEDPYNANEWIEKIYCSKGIEKKSIHFELYDKSYSARKYVELFNKVFE